jgi:hypothetical protein
MRHDDVEFSFKSRAISFHLEVIQRLLEELNVAFLVKATGNFGMF